MNAHEDLARPAEPRSFAVRSGLVKKVDHLVKAQSWPSQGLALASKPNPSNANEGHLAVGGEPGVSDVLVKDFARPKHLQHTRGRVLQVISP